MILEAHFKTECKAAVEIGVACVKVKTVNSLIDIERIDALGIDLKILERGFFDESTGEVVAYRDVAHLDEATILILEQTCKRVGGTG